MRGLFWWAERLRGGTPSYKSSEELGLRLGVRPFCQGRELAIITSAVPTALPTHAPKTSRRLIRSLTVVWIY